MTAADTLHAAARALGNPALRRAADSYDRAARTRYGRTPAATAEGAQLRAAARLLAMAGQISGDTTLATAALIANLAALAAAVAQLREAQQRAAQAAAARAAAAQLHAACVQDRFPALRPGGQRITSPAARRPRPTSPAATSPPSRDPAIPCPPHPPGLARVRAGDRCRPGEPGGAAESPSAGSGSLTDLSGGARLLAGRRQGDLSTGQGQPAETLIPGLGDSAIAVMGRYPGLPAASGSGRRQPAAPSSPPLGQQLGGRAGVVRAGPVRAGALTAWPSFRRPVRVPHGSGTLDVPLPLVPGAEATSGPGVGRLAIWPGSSER